MVQNYRLINTDTLAPFWCVVIQDVLIINGTQSKCHEYGSPGWSKTADGPENPYKVYHYNSLCFPLMLPPWALNSVRPKCRLNNAPTIDKTNNMAKAAKYSPV